MVNRSSARQWLPVSHDRWLVILIIIVTLLYKLPLYVVNPEWIMRPVAAVYDHEAQEIQLTRETPASRLLPFIDAYAAYNVEARLKTSPIVTCEGPEGATTYEVIGEDNEKQPPKDTTRIGAKWMQNCIGGAPIEYHVDYRVAVRIGQVTVWLPRVIQFDEVFFPHAAERQDRQNVLEERVDRLEEKVNGH